MPDGEKLSFERVSFVSDASLDDWLTMQENKRRKKRESLK